MLWLVKVARLIRPKGDALCGWGLRIPELAHPGVHAFFSTTATKQGPIKQGGHLQEDMKFGRSYIQRDYLQCRMHTHSRQSEIQTIRFPFFYYSTCYVGGILYCSPFWSHRSEILLLLL